MTTNPGFADQARKRTTARLIGFGLIAVGLAIAIKGGYEFVQDVNSPALDTGPGGFAGILMLGAGGFLVVFGLAALSAGYLGATARYSAGETMPVAKDSAAYLTDGRGLLGVGRTADDRTGDRGGDPADDTRTGPFCTSCGVRNDETAKFCDACGHAIG